MRASELLQKKRTGVLEIFKQYEKFGIHNPRVFGSIATRTDTEKSDIDFIVDIDKIKDFSYFKLGGLFMDLKDFLGVEIDLVMSHCLKDDDIGTRILKEARKF